MWGPSIDTIGRRGPCSPYHIITRYEEVEDETTANDGVFFMEHIDFVQSFNRMELVRISTTAAAAAITTTNTTTTRCGSTKPVTAGTKPCT